MPMGEEVKWLLKEGGGLIFECFDISLESTPTLHVVYISTPTNGPQFYLVLWAFLSAFVRYCKLLLLTCYLSSLPL